jgi:hypothetical protein
LQDITRRLELHYDKLGRHLRALCLRPYAPDALCEAATSAVVWVTARLGLVRGIISFEACLIGLHCIDSWLDGRLLSLHHNLFPNYNSKLLTATIANIYERVYIMIAATKSFDGSRGCFATTVLDHMLILVIGYNDTYIRHCFTQISSSL